MEIFFIIAILIFSFWVAIYGDSKYRFYENEYRKYHVEQSLNMKMDDVMDVTVYMMDYLIGKEETLSVHTDVDGEYQDFFNEQDRLHMWDVKNLFIGGLRLGGALMIIVLAMAVILYKRKMLCPNVLIKGYLGALGTLTVLLILLGIAFYIDFTRCFTIFHQIFFTNDLWMFDSATDYMIRMLPEGFFFDMCIRILKTFCGFLLMPLCMLIIWDLKWKKKIN